MTVKLGKEEWELFEAISETYALPSSPHYLDPMEFNRLLRRRVPPRGQRFANDHRDTCAYIERSKNANVVAYTANLIVPAQSAEAKTAYAAPSDVSTPAGKEKAYVLSHYHNEPAIVRDYRQPAPTTAKAASSPTSSASGTSAATATQEWVPVPSGIGIKCRIDVANPAHVYFVRLEPSYLEARRKKGIRGDCDELKMLERKFGFGYNNKVFDVERHIREQFPEHAKAGGVLDKLLRDGGEAQRAATLASLVAWWRKLPPLVMSFVPLPAWPMLGLLLKPLRAASPATAQSHQEGSNAIADGMSGVKPNADETEALGGGNASSWCDDADTIGVLLALVNDKICILEKVYVKSIERWFGLPSAEHIEVTGTRLEDGKTTKERRDKDNQYVHPNGAE